MAESLKKLKELFDLKDADLRTYSPLTLAYIGDGVYELVIRTILVKKANCPVNRLHKKASSLVKASSDIPCCSINFSPIASLFVADNTILSSEIM